MNRTTKLVAIGASAALLLIADVSPEAPLGLTLAREAAAVVGAPLTPVSGAGVARRTTRRVVVASSASASASQQQTAQQQQATAQQQAETAKQQAAVAEQQAATAKAQTAAPAGPLPVGTVVAALPAGCVAAPISGVEYYLCSGTYYRAAFQGNNLVYVVSKP